MVTAITVNPLFKALDDVLDGNERLAFKLLVGGDWNDPRLPADVRAASAAKAEHVLEFIDQQGGAHSTASNGEIDGKVEDVPDLPAPYLTREHFTYPGSEARRLSDFAYVGYAVFEKR